MGEVEIGPESRPPWEYSRGWPREKLLIYRDLIPGGIGGLKIPLVPGQARTERVRMSQEEMAHQQRRSQRAENNLKFVIPRMKSQEPENNTVHDWIISILKKEKEIEKEIKKEEESDNMNESHNNTKAEIDFKIKIYNKFLLSEQNKIKQKLITEVSNRDLERLGVLSQDNVSDPIDTEVYVINDPSRGFVKNVGGYDVSTELSPLSALGMIALGGVGGKLKGVVQGALRKRAAGAKLTKLIQTNRATVNKLRNIEELKRSNYITRITDPYDLRYIPMGPRRANAINTYENNLRKMIDNTAKKQFDINADRVAALRDIDQLGRRGRLAWRIAEHTPLALAAGLGGLGAMNSIRQERDMRKAGLSNNTDTDWVINAATQFVTPFIGKKVGEFVAGSVNRGMYRRYLRARGRGADQLWNQQPYIFNPDPFSLESPETHIGSLKSLFGSRTGVTIPRGFKGFKVNNATIYNQNPDVGIDAYNKAISPSPQRTRRIRGWGDVASNLGSWMKRNITDPISPAGRQGLWKAIKGGGLLYALPSVASAGAGGLAAAGGLVGIDAGRLDSTGAANEWNRWRGDNITKQEEISGRRQATADSEGSSVYISGNRVAAGGYRASETESPRKHAARRMASDQGLKPEYDPDRIYIVKKNRTLLDLLSPRPVDVLYTKKQTSRHRMIPNVPLNPPPKARLVTLPTDPDLVDAAAALEYERLQ